MSGFGELWCPPPAQLRRVTQPRRCGQARTYAGLIEKIPYRQDLGVSAVSCSPSLPSTNKALHRVGIEVILDAVYTTSGRVERRPSHDLLSRIGDKAASSSPRIISLMNSRTRSRIPASIGSNQSSKSWEADSVRSCAASIFVWSPVRHSNAR
jgi:hypothetical protein